METLHFNKLLLKTAFSCMACDGDIDKREIKLIKRLHQEKKAFGDIDVNSEMDNLLIAINKDGHHFLKGYFNELTNTELTEANELKLIEVAIDTISTGRQSLTASDLPEKFYIDVRPKFNSSGLKMIEIRDDGDCFYRAIATFRGEEELRGPLREAALDYLGANPAQFEGVKGLVAGKTEELVYGVTEYEDLSQYIELHKDQNVHADQPDIIAVSKSCNINIGIKREGQERIEYFMSDDPLNADTVYLHYTNGNHYDLFKAPEGQSKSLHSFTTGELYHEMKDDVFHQWPGLDGRQITDAILMKDAQMPLDDIYEQFDADSSHLNKAKQIQDFLESYKSAGLARSLSVQPESTLRSKIGVPKNYDDRRIEDIGEREKKAIDNNDSLQSDPLINRSGANNAVTDLDKNINYNDPISVGKDASSRIELQADSEIRDASTEAERDTKEVAKDTAQQEARLAENSMEDI